MTDTETDPQGRLDIAIAAAADALLAVCSLQTGTSPAAALDRAAEALLDTVERGYTEAMQK